MSTVEPTYQLYANASEIKSAHHDVILQSLDTWRDYTDQDGTKKKLFFGVENFEGTEPAWQGLPLIYSDKSHPQVAYTINPDGALNTSDGKIVGSFSDPAIVLNGSPRFTGVFSFSDPEVQKLHETGELQFSSGFLSNIGDDGKLTGKVTPDHILIFKKSKDGLQPQDGGAMFLNATRPEMEDTEIKGLFSKILEALTAISPTKGEKPITNATGPDMTEELNSKISVLNARVETLTSTIQEKDAAIASLTDEVTAFKTEQTKAAELKQEADWQNIKTTMLAPGLIANPELEKEQRDLWMQDKDAFYCNAVSNRPAPKGKEGNLIANAGTNPDAEMDAYFAARPGVPGTFH